MSDKTFYGKYRGVVTNNDDPLKQGRLKVRVPDIMSEDESGWALPCFPFLGHGMGIFGLPVVGSGVWVEFEQGNPDYPIWAGCWAASQQELPSQVTAAPELKKEIAIVTEGKHFILFDDRSGEGGITLQTSSGQKLIMNQQGITLDNGEGATITLKGPQISLNNGKGSTIDLQVSQISLNDGAGATVSLEGPQVSINNGALEVL